MAITINGASDDIIEINGDITEELNVLGHERGTLTLSDGTVIRYDVTDEDDGTWRFKVDKAGAAQVTVEAASAARRPVYSDHVRVEGDVESVRCDSTGDEVRK